MEKPLVITKDMIKVRRGPLHLKPLCEQAGHRALGLDRTCDKLETGGCWMQNMAHGQTINRADFQLINRGYGESRIPFEC